MKSTVDDGQPGSAWRLLLGHARPYRRTLLVAAVISCVGGLAGLAQPLAAKAVIDALSANEPVLTPIILLTGLVVGAAVIAAIGTYLLERAAEGVVLVARRGLVHRLLRLPVAEFDRLKPGDLLSRVTSDTTLLRTAATSTIVEAANGTLMIVGTIVLMALLDPVLLGVTLAVILVTVVLTGSVVPRIGRASERAQQAVGEMGAVLERALGAFRTVKASGAEERENAVLDQAADRAWRQGVSVAVWSSMVGILARLSVHVSFLAVLGVGGARVADGTLPLSALIAFLLYVFYMITPIAALVNAASDLQAGLAAVRRTRQVHILPTEPAAQGAPATVTATGPASVAFHGVSFGYPGNRESVLTDISFQTPPGGMTAFVGPSGAGKSTIFALLERFYEPAAGSILLDGRDVRDWPLAELRAAIGYVEQDAPVLAATLRDNLRLAAPHASDEDIHDVIVRTRLDDLLPRLPDGLDTMLGHRGLTLSGGQRQRIAIARALLRRGGRSHLTTRRRERTPTASSGGRTGPQHHRPRRGAPAVHCHQRRPNPGPRRRQAPRERHSHAPDLHRRALPSTRRHPATHHTTPALTPVPPNIRPSAPDFLHGRLKDLPVRCQ